MRIRTIKPEFWTNEDLATVSESAMLLAVGLLNYADDDGYFNARPELIKSAVFPLREPSVSVHGMLTELSRIGFVELCDGSDNRQYGRVANFGKHQRINRPTKSQIACFWTQNTRTHGGLTEDSLNAHGGLTEDSLPERKGKEGKGKEDNPPISSQLREPQNAKSEQGLEPDAAQGVAIASSSGVLPSEVEGMFRINVLTEEANEPDGPEEKARARMVAGRIGENDQNRPLGPPRSDSTKVDMIRRQAQEMRERAARSGA